ncbi:MAG: hypothetical protein P8M16_07985 [Acidimicrobiales bacterium]|nr:hypothetical protein [Acidimicrobiales bacterium]
MRNYGQRSVGPAVGSAACAQPMKPMVNREENLADKASGHLGEETMRRSAGLMLGHQLRRSWPPYRHPRHHSVGLGVESWGDENLKQARSVPTSIYLSIPT